MTEVYLEVYMKNKRNPTVGPLSMTPYCSWWHRLERCGYCPCQSQTVCNYDEVLNFLNLTNIPGSDVRPVKDWRNTTQVDIDVFFYTVVSLDTSLQSLTTFVWFSMTWQNEFISWNPDDFCGITQIFITDGTLWKPDLYIYEMTEVNDNSPVILYYTIYNDGRIKDSEPLRIVSSCNLDIYKFPFDSQTCSLTFGPYIHPVTDIIMVPSSNSSTVFQNAKDIFVSKGDWSLENLTVETTTINSQEVYYSQVIYKVTLKRSPIVYIVNLIIPSCFLVLLDIASMFIQPEERLGFKITVVLGFSVLLLILNDILPDSDNPPVLGIFCNVCLAIMVLSILGSIASTYMITLSDTKPTVPSWIRIWIMKHLARALCFHLKSMEDDLVTVVSCDNRNNGEYSRKTEVELQERIKGSPRDTRVSLEVKLLKKLLVEVLRIHQELVISKNKDEAKSEWHIAALVVDRLVLIIYLIIVIIIFAVVTAVWTS
ncbi:5-hydroxytryptamine receptor 3A-like [Pelodytes ibericus]